MVMFRPLTQLLMYTVSSLSFIATPVLAVDTQPATDRLGRPVLDAEGGRIEYSEVLPLRNGSPSRPERPGLGSLPVAPNNFEITTEWYYTVMGSGIGASGLETVDLDGDGVSEILASSTSTGGFGQNDFWYTLLYRDGDYGKAFSQLQYSDDLRALRTFNFDDDADVEVVVGLSSTVLVYDGATLQLLNTIQTEAENINGLEIADVDGDGEPEIVLCDRTDLFVYDAASGVLERRGDGYGGDDLAIGNVDADGDLEIVVGNDNGTSWVFDGPTGAIEWTKPSGFGFHVEVGDLDGDGMEEIVAGDAWYYITVYDADLQSPAYEIRSELDIDAVVVADVEGDGTFELVYGDGQWGAIYVHEGATGALKWSIDNPEHGVTGIAFGDLDGDGTIELFWGAGYSSTGPDYLFAADTLTRTIEWQSTHLDGPFYAMDHGDVDADARPELLIGSYESESGYGDGLYLVFDAVTKALKFTSPEPTGSNWMGLSRIRQANLDDDAQSEILITTSETYTGILKCYDGVDYNEQWSASVPESGEAFRALAVADIDQDGALEIVAGTEREHTGALGTYLRVYDATSGWPEWSSVDLGAYWGSLSLLRVGEIDDDPNPEMVIADYQGQLYVYDGVTKLMELELPDIDITALDLADIDGDGRSELVVGDQGGVVQLIDGITGTPIETVTSLGERVDGLDVIDVTGDGGLDYVLSAADEVVIFDGLDTSTALWRSGIIGTGVGVDDSLLVADIDQDEKLELVTNLGHIGVMVFEIDGPPSGGCPEDLNGDGRIDFRDLGIVLRNWGNCPPEGECPADINTDGLVNMDDLRIVFANRGECSP